MIIGFNHITRTGGNALLRCLHGAAKPAGFQIAALDAITPQAQIDALPDGPCLFAHSHLMSGAHERVAQTFEYITIVRDPVAHVLSEFSWCHGIELFDLSHSAIMDRLQAYLHGFDHLDHQCFVIATPVAAWPVMEAHPNTQNLGHASAQLADDALRTIEARYAFVGTTERLADNLAYFEHRFGFTDLRLAGDAFTNRMATGRLSKAALPPSLHDQIIAKTRQDQALYDHAARQDAGVAHAGAVPARGADYICRLGQPWRFFVEGLMALGASAARRESAWTLDFALPVAAPRPPLVQVTLSLLAFGKHGRMCVLRCAVRIGGQHCDTEISGRHEVTAIVDEDALQEGAIAISLRAVPLNPEDDDVYTFNPLPFMIDSILVGAVA